MRSIFKHTFSAALMASVVLAITGCGGQDAQTNEGSAGKTSESGVMTSESSDNKEGSLIKVAVGADLVEWAEKCADQYQEAHPNTEIELIEIMSTSDRYAKVTMMMQNPQTCPDIITEDGFMINADAAAGYLEPLDDMLASWDDSKNFSEAILAGGKGPDGKQYAIPYSTDVQFIWYNKQLMEQAGVEVPFEPKTWDDIMDAAKKMKAIDVEIPMFLYASKTSPEETSMRTFQTLYTGTGGELYDFEEKKWVVDKENLRKVFDFVNQVYNIEQVGPPLSIAAQPKIYDLFQSDYMKNGKIGMYFSGSWEAGNWGTGKKYEWPEGLDVWGVAKIPTIDGQEPGYTTMSGGWTWAVPANGQNKEEAKEFLKILCNKENSLSYAMITGNIAVRDDVAADSEYSSQEMSVVNEAADALQYTHFRPSVDGYSTVTTMYTEVIESIAMGGVSPEDAIVTFETELKRIVGDENVLVK